MNQLILLSAALLLLAPTISFAEKTYSRDNLIERSGILYEKSPITGTLNSYYESGKLQSEVNYQNGKEEGFWKTYHENGKLSAKGNIKNGKAEGSGKPIIKMAT